MYSFTVTRSCNNANVATVSDADLMKAVRRLSRVLRNSYEIKHDEIVFACGAAMANQNAFLQGTFLVEASYVDPYRLVTRTNLMTGEEYQEPANTPLSCSPASETYWSM